MNFAPKMISERNLIVLLALISFVNILDFMMVMPLGPDFARELKIPASEIGLIGGAYTFAAAILGLIASLFLDEFSRRRAVLFCMTGLMLATFAGAMVWDRESMIVARLVAGMFGGPLSSLSMMLVADYIPPERRGRAMGKVSGAFALASVLGVPFGLELARRISWHAPFIVTGILALIVLLMILLMLPYNKPIASPHKVTYRIRALWGMMRKPLAATSFLFMGCTMMAGFMIIPNIAAHVQMNLGFPREQLGVLYLVGGTVSFFGMRASGWLIDKKSSTFAVCIFTTSLIAALFIGFVVFPTGIPEVLFFTFFMVSMSGRMVAVQTLSSKIPAPAERGAYMSIQSAVTHLSSALGAYYSSLVLVEVSGKLEHMPVVGMTAIGLSLCVPFLVWSVERRVRLAAKKQGFQTK